MVRGYTSLYGDFTLGNQGEDVVSGLVKTLPISIKQQDEEMRDTDITLETHFPEIYNALEKMAKELIYKRGWSPQEMEFTFEGPTVDKLYILQTRDMAIRGRKEVFKFDLEQHPNGANASGPWNRRGRRSHERTSRVQSR
jgi:pyruvate, orthophosphate dikinase